MPQHGRKYGQKDRKIKKAKKKKNKMIFIAIGTVAGVAAVACAAFGISRYLAEQNAGDDYIAIRDDVKDETTEPPDTTEETDTPVEIPIDFDALKERNPDVYAWITVPDTNIDYPILHRDSDNSYYLNHTIDNEEKIEGAIFTENYNNTDFEDPNTLIYGHDMRNGSMFQNLLNYQDREYFDEHRDIVIYTPDAIRHYTVFAAYPYDDRHILQSFNFALPSVYQQYLDMVFSIRDMSSIIDTSMDVGTDDKIITLSTCYGNQHDKRFLVQAVLVSIEK